MKQEDDKMQQQCQAPMLQNATTVPGTYATSVSVVVITVGREPLYALVPEILAQETEFDFEVVLVANGPVDRTRLPSERVSVIDEPTGLGIPYYRNRGIEAAAGSVIVFIDDDECTTDAGWLQRIAGPVVEGRETVTVAGAVIELGQGRLADLISLLGYPGGGALGWRSVWNVDDSGYTDKLCTCNCAIARSALEDVGGLHESLVLGASDLYLGEQLMERGNRILFIDDACVIHEPRRDLGGFARWQFNRGRSIYELKTVRPLSEFSRSHVGGRFRRTWVILERTFPTARFIPMLGILFLEFALHALGYAYEYAKHSLSGRR